MTSQTGKQIIPIHILPNISRSKENQAMKFGQLLEYNVNKYFPSKIMHWIISFCSAKYFIFAAALFELNSLVTITM